MLGHLVLEFYNNARDRRTDS